MPMNKYTAHLIDPVKRTITEVTIDKDNGIQDYYDQLHCNIFTAVEINANRDTIYIDDEGLFVPNQVFFYHKDYPSQPLAGYGLVIGTDEEGESIAPTVTLQETIDSVKFMSRSDVLDWVRNNPDA
jgi:hypothetical protein